MRAPTAAQLLSTRAGTGFGKRFRHLKLRGGCKQTQWHWMPDLDTCLWQKKKNINRDNCLSEMQCSGNALQLWEKNLKPEELPPYTGSHLQFYHSWSSTLSPPERTCWYWRAVHQHVWAATDHPARPEQRGSQRLTFCPSLSTHTITRLDCLHGAAAGRKKGVSE